MANTLKIRDTEPVLPGLALPEAFELLEKRLESTVKLCKLSSSSDGQVLSVIAICQEFQRLLKCAFVENGLLASRLELFTQYHCDSINKMNKKISAFDIEHKITKKQIKRLRKKISVNDTYQRRKSEKWWDVKVRDTDYESFKVLSRSIGSPDLEFMLRVNQILIDFVRDEERTELQLPPMGSEERAEVSKLASIYKIRCRYGKSTQLAPSTLMKARQTCIPGHGEVDAILDGFARAKTIKRLMMSTDEVVLQPGDIEEAKEEVAATEEVSSSGGAKGKQPKTPLLSATSIPSTMLTPLSSLTSPTIDLSAIALTPSQSPPTSGLNTPTADQVTKGGGAAGGGGGGGGYGSGSSDKVKIRSRSASQSSESPLPVPASAIRAGKTSNLSRSSQPPCPTSASSATGAGGGGASSGNETPPIATGTLSSLHMQSQSQLAKTVIAPKPSNLIQQQQQQHHHHQGGGGGGLSPALGSSGVMAATAGLASGHGMAAVLTPSLPQALQQQQQHHHHHQHMPLAAAASLLSSSSSSSLRLHGAQPTVVASPLKVPVSQLPQTVKHNLNLGGGGGGGGGADGVKSGGEGVASGGSEGGGDGESVGGRKELLPEAYIQPPKRIRLTRKSTDVINTED